MKVEKALEQIEQIVRQIDPIQLYQSSLGHELQNIVRKVRHDLREDEIQKAIGSRTF